MVRHIVLETGAKVVLSSDWELLSDGYCEEHDLLTGTKRYRQWIYICKKCRCCRRIKG